MDIGSLASQRLLTMPSNPACFELSFANGSSAQAICVQTADAMPKALEQLGLYRPAPVLVLVGGASHLSRLEAQRLTGLFTHLLAPLAEELGMTVIDGGTDAGVMQLMGMARAACRATFPLVGIAPLGKVYLPNHRPIAQLQALEPNHSHFLLVPGQHWGDESPWIAKTASLIAGNAPSLTLLINGGSIALVDLHESIAHRRPVVVMTGTGRLADEITVALRNPEAEMGTGISLVVRSGIVELSKTTTQLRNALCRHFQSDSRRAPVAQLPA